MEQHMPLIRLSWMRGIRVCGSVFEHARSSIQASRRGEGLLLAAFLFSGVSLSISSWAKDPAGPSSGGPDTTSHSFSLSVIHLGDGASSALFDIANINDTLAYAVGAVYKRDSIGNWDPLPYDLAKWNGSTWELKRISVQFRGREISPPIYGIHANSATDIWLAAGMAIHGNGSSWTPYDVRLLTGRDSLSFTKCWGTVNFMYFVGDRGSMAQFDGSKWTYMSSGTSLDIRDIFGSQNALTRSWEILAIASQQYTSFERRILRISGLSVDALPDVPLAQPLSTCWFVSGVRYIVAGSGIHEKGTLEEVLWRPSPDNGTRFYIEAIRGTAANDIFAVGHFGECVHYSGRTWKSYSNQTAIASGAYFRVAANSQSVIMVGQSSPLAVILMGTRTR
jgi:hypothetical protein